MVLHTVVKCLANVYSFLKLKSYILVLYAAAVVVVQQQRQQHGQTQMATWENDDESRISYIYASIWCIKMAAPYKA